MKRLMLLAGEESGAGYARRIAARAQELFPGVEVLRMDKTRVVQFTK